MGPVRRLSNFVLTAMLYLRELRQLHRRNGVFGPFLLCKLLFRTRELIKLSEPSIPAVRTTDTTFSDDNLQRAAGSAINVSSPLTNAAIAKRPFSAAPSASAQQSSSTVGSSDLRQAGGPAVGQPSLMAGATGTKRPLIASSPASSRHSSAGPNSSAWLCL